MGKDHEFLMRMRGRGVAQKAKLKMQSVGSSSKPQILTDFSGIICPDRLEEPRSLGSGRGELLRLLKDTT